MPSPKSLGLWKKRGWKALQVAPHQAKAWPQASGSVRGPGLTQVFCHPCWVRGVSLESRLLPDSCPLIASSDDMTLTSPSMDNSSTELLPSGDSPLNKRMTENLLASLSEHERAAILSVPAAQNPEDLRMFARWERMTGGAASESRVRTGRMGMYPTNPSLNPLMRNGSHGLR